MKKRIAVFSSVLFIASCSSSNNDPASSPMSDFASNGSDDITESNTNAVILQAFEVLTGRAYDARLTVFPYTQQIEIEVAQSNEPLQQRLSPSNCSNTGQVDFLSELDHYTYTTGATYSDCLVGGDTLNGSVTLQENIQSDPNSLATLHQHARKYGEGFTVEFEPGGRMQLGGVYKMTPSLTHTRVVGVDNFNYALIYSGGELVVNNATTIRTFRLDGYQDNLGHIAYMAGSFSMRPPVVNGTNVNVEVTEPFVNVSTVSQLSYERGSMRISSANSEVVLEADNGNPDTVTITSSIDGAVAVIKDEPWSVWMDALAYEPPPFDTAIPNNPTTARSDAIREDNYQALLTEVFSIFTGERFGTELLNLPGYPLPELPPGLLTPGADDGLGEAMTVSCTNGGSVDLRTYKWGARQITGGWNSEFDVCDQDGMRYEGSYYTREFGNFRNGSLDGISVSSDNSSQQFKGSIEYKHRSNRDGGPSVYYALSGDYSANRDSGVYKLNNASLYLGGLYDLTTLINGQFYIQSPATENEALHVHIADPIVRDNLDYEELDYTYFEWGTLLLSAGNGNRLTLEANNGNIDTFDITIDQPEQAQFKTTQIWASWKQAVMFTRDLHSRE